MAPQSPLPGLIVSKLGVEATASGETVSWSLCLKVSIPLDGPRTRYPLFVAPELKSRPLVQSSPLRVLPSGSSSSTHTTDAHLATRLLSLSTTSSASSHAHTQSGTPTVDQINGQVYVCVSPDVQRTVRSRSPNVLNGIDSGWNASPGSSSGYAGSNTGRQDWVIVLHFEAEVEMVRAALPTSRITIPLPKCLDNVLRFRISSSSDETNEGEVSILTEPRILPLPSSTFESPTKANGSSSTLGAHRGRLDHQGPVGGRRDMNGYGSGSSSEEEYSREEENEGSWLEGRFQSTDSLSLEWSYAELGGPSSSSHDPMSKLEVIPSWQGQNSTIPMSYNGHFVPDYGASGGVDQDEVVVPIEAILPDGWGWSSLSISGKGLVGWKSIDGNYWDERFQSSVDEEAYANGHAGPGGGVKNGYGSGQYDQPSDSEDNLDLDHMEDSFSTLRHHSQTPRRKSLHANGQPPDPQSIIRGYHPTPLSMSSRNLGSARKVPHTPVSASSSSASLLRQTLPSMDHIEDFSFELSSEDPASPNGRNDPNAQWYQRSNGGHSPAGHGYETGGGANTPRTPRMSPPSSTDTTLVNPAVDGRKTVPSEPGRSDPRPERLFDLYFALSTSGRDVVSFQFTLKGTIVPLRHTLVTPTLPTSLPFIKVDLGESPSSSSITRCLVSCPGATLSHADSDGNGIIDLDGLTGANRSIGTFRWTEEDGSLVPPRDGQLWGSTRVSIHRSTRGTKMTLMIPCSSRASEVGFTLPVASSRVKVLRSSMGSRVVPSVVVDQGAISEPDPGAGNRSGRGEDSSAIRIGTMGRSGNLEVVLSVLSDDADEEEEGRSVGADGVVLPLPCFEGQGEMTLQLKGDLTRISRDRFTGNFVPASLATSARPAPHGTIFTFPFSSSSPPPSLVISSPTRDGTNLTSGNHEGKLTVPARKWRSRAILSWSTLFNLLVLWIMLSMGQQVQRLRNEVAFVVDETRDLRLYGVPRKDSQTPRTRDHQHDSKDDGSTAHQVVVNGDGNVQGVGAEDDPLGHRDGSVSATSVALGRVVLGDNIWTSWAYHPTVQSLSRGIGWIWHTVVWLLAAK